MLQINQVENRLEKLVAEDLSVMGFSRTGIARYTKRYKMFEETISFRIVRVSSDFGILYNCLRSYFLIENFWMDLIEKYNLSDTTCTVFVNRTIVDPSLEKPGDPLILKGGGIVLKTTNNDDDLNNFKVLFFKEYENLILPFLHQTENVKWLDAQINAEPLFKQNTNSFELNNSSKLVPLNGLAFKKLIVAKLAGNDKFEYLYTGMKARLGKVASETGNSKVEQYLECLQIVYERLKDVKKVDEILI